MGVFGKSVIFYGSAAVFVAVAVPGTAQYAQPEHRFDLAPQELKYALRSVTRAANLELFATSEDLRGRQSVQLHGTMPVQAALDQLLAGSGLVAEVDGKRVFVRKIPPGAPPVPGVTSSADSDIVVTGSHIKGATSASPVLTLSQRQILDAGFSDLGQVIRSIPQNFSGGQNPGITFTAPGDNQNVTSGSSLDLRGLGPDATLTLLNGHRIAYDSAIQAIDLSSIPIAALDRLEIVPDGASALYGSDAVAGVANIVLKRDFDGLDLSTRLGTATSGGDTTQQYSGVGGSRWSSGGFITTVDVQRSTDVNASQRSFTGTLPADTTLIPRQHVISLVTAGHQDLSTDVHFDIDSFYSHRTSRTYSAYDLAGYAAYGAEYRTRLTSFEVSPEISVDLPGEWTSRLRGIYGEDNAHGTLNFYIGGQVNTQYPSIYRNTMKAVEAAAEGPVVRLPAGQSRVAVGLGSRSSGLHGYLGSISGGETSIQDEFTASRPSYYAYAELLAPLISGDMAIPAIRRLSFTAAGRFEHYPSVANVFTPKLGLVYSPSDDADIKASWGKSFKAPTLYQQELPRSAVLSDASQFGSGYPTTASVLVIDGGNATLKPERATTWTATLAIHPRALSGAHLDVTFFHVRYRNRILEALADGNDAGALTNPAYRDLVNLDPNIASIDAVIANAAGGLENQTAAEFDPSNVVAIIDDRYNNVSSYSAKGVDIALSGTIKAGRFGKVTPAASASYLQSSKKDTAESASSPQAGTIFNPPHWRARADLLWEAGTLSVDPAINYTGGVSDERALPYLHVRSMKTFDLTGRYRPPSTGPLRGIYVAVSILNLANSRPGRIAVPAFYFPAYDPTNYSALGRFVSFSLGKHW